LDQGRDATLVSIQGIRATGRHGADPGEQDEAQEFVVDLAVWVSVPHDDLEATVDYRSIVDAARRTVETDSYQLLEVLAEAVASAVLDLGRIVRVSTVVHKPRAATAMHVDDVAAEVTLNA
jgi:dihydroneopterin aldolase